MRFGKLAKFLRKPKHENSGQGAQNPKERISQKGRLQNNFGQGPRAGKIALDLGRIFFSKPRCIGADCDSCLHFRKKGRRSLALDRRGLAFLPCGDGSPKNPFGFFFHKRNNDFLGAFVRLGPLLVGRLRGLPFGDGDFFFDHNLRDASPLRA